MTRSRGGEYFVAVLQWNTEQGAMTRLGGFSEPDKSPKI
jgi:hypothetical protein